MGFPVVERLPFADNPYAANEGEENDPLYQAVREWVHRVSRGGWVLDLGCNNLAATR
jgi:hypothetical protein